MLFNDLNSKKDSVDSEAIITHRSYSVETVKRDFRLPIKLQGKAFLSDGSVWDYWASTW